MVAAVALLLLFGGGAFAGWFYFVKRLDEPYNGPVWTVKYDRLQMTIVERGALESAQNSDIVCGVKARTQGNTIATTIKWVIDDGTSVSKGEKLIELDSSGLEEQLKAKNIDLDNAQAAAVKAETDLEITRIENASLIKTAEVAVEIAELNLRKYVEGDYLQALKDVQGRIAMARSDRELQLDRVAWSERMVKKGYQTKTQSDAERSKLDSMELTFNKAVEELRVLERYTKRVNETDLRNKLEEARRDLDKKKAQAKSKEVQATAEHKARVSVLRQEEQRKKEIQEEIAKCVLSSPQDGLVVYFIPEQSRFGSGAQQSTIAQGEPVREGQKMMRIPDLTKMIVNTRVHEAMVSRVRGEENGSGGQKATVRVDAFPNRVLKGHVKSVATVASQADWMSADVKVYTTLVSIDEEVEGLKPGMSAEVTIYAGNGLEHVLTVPVQAIFGSVSLGVHRKVFVLDRDNRPVERDIVVGLNNEMMAEVKSGLGEGERVVLNPRQLLRDKIKQNSKSGGKGVEDLEPGGAEGAPKGKGKGGEKAKKAGPPNGLGLPNGPRGPEGPGVGPKGPNGPAGFGTPTPEQMQQWQRLQQQIQNASPQERRQILNREVPDAALRNRIVEGMRAKGLQVAD